MKRISHNPELWDLGSVGEFKILRRGKVRLHLCRKDGLTSGISLTIRQLERILILGKKSQKKQKVS